MPAEPAGRSYMCSCPYYGAMILVLVDPPGTVTSARCRKCHKWCVVTAEWGLTIDKGTGAIGLIPPEPEQTS
jgi:hypothetical protein